MNGEANDTSCGWWEWLAETAATAVFESEAGFVILLLAFCGLFVFAIGYGIHQWLTDPGTTLASIVPASDDLKALSINPDNWKF